MEEEDVMDPDGSEALELWLNYNKYAQTFLSRAYQEKLENKTQIEG